MSVLKKNLSLQTAYQVLLVITPLITAPYLARKLGAEQLGVFSYTTSIVAYFTLIAMLGTINYGTRSIAAAKGDRQKRNEIFTCVFLLQISVTLIASIAYAVYLLFFCRENRVIAILQGIALLSCLVDVTWLYFGVEDFLLTVTRSIIIKIITIALILIFVRREADLWIYTLIMVGGSFASNAVLFFRLSKYASFTKVSFSQIREHIKPNLALFVPLLAMTVYHTMDKTMLGALSDYDQSGYYYNSDKIIQIPLVIISGIGTVMLPRISSLLAEGKRREADDLFMTTMEGVAAVGVAIACGIAAISNEFVPLFFGEGYEPCIILTIVLTPIFLFKGFSSIARTQYLVPMKMEKEFTASVVGGAVVNLVLNLILIPKYGALGAVIATVIAELIACVLQFMSLRSYNLGIGKLLLKTALYLAMGLTMVVIVRAVALLHINTVVKLVLEIVAGASYFAAVCLFYWVKTRNRFYGILIQPVVKRFKKTKSGGQ